MARKNKTNNILDYMMHHDGITSMQAFEMFGATRLSAIIFNLKKKGYNIATIEMRGVDRNGYQSRYAKYVLKGVE